MGVEGGASQQGHLILAVHTSITRVVRSSLAAEDLRTMWEQLEDHEQSHDVSQYYCQRLQKLFLMQYTKRKQLQRQQTRD